MKYTLTMDLDNAAFEGDSEDARDGHDIAEVLRKAAAGADGLMVCAGSEWPLRDANGNQIGKAEVTN